jgi:hypothetical protein
VHVFFPMYSWTTKEALPTMALPEDFWLVWGGVCSVWMIGRSAEKLGVGGSMVKGITGGIR